jgi:phosphatidate cytidylyltransferase
MTEFIRRTLSGAIYAGLIIGSIAAGPMAFSVLVILALMLAVRENAALKSFPKSAVFLIPVQLALLFMYAGLTAYWFRYLRFGEAGLLVLLSILPLLALFFSSWRIKAATLLHHSILWLLIPLFFLTILADPFRTQVPRTDWLLGTFVLIWVNDSFAYLSGVLLGRHPLWPSISPKKTWEGFVGGLIFTLAAGIGWAQWYSPEGYMQWFWIALMVTLAGTLGDLYESWLKRKAGMKDSSGLIPGHGGILDRLDSLLFAAPAVFLLIILFFAD